MKNFQVVPLSVIKGGEASYSLDLSDSKKAIISYRLEVKAGLFWPLIKTFNYVGTYSVDKKLLDPSNYESAGASIDVNGLKAKVLSVTNYPVHQIAVLDLELLGNTGTAEIILNRPVELKKLKVEVSLNGKKFEVELEEASA